jgi:putative transport protein
MGGVFAFLNREPFALLFLVMAGGYALGKVSVKGISLGPTATSLVIAIGISFWAKVGFGIEFSLPSFASTIFFNLFMFSIGMKVGPQFLSGLNRGAKRYVLIAFLVPLLALALAVILSALLRPSPGVAAGLFAGSNTATPGLAAANAAFETGVVTLPEGADLRATLGDMSTAFACSYCVSTVVFVLFLKALPGLFGRDARAEAQAFEREMGGGAPLPGTMGYLIGPLPVQQRTYQIEEPDFAGKSLGALRAERPFVAVEHLRRGDTSLRVTDETVLERGDRITVFGRVPVLIEAAERLGPEVDDPLVPEPNWQTVEVVQKNPAVVGMTLMELVRSVGHGLYLNAMFRAGEEIPRGSEVVIRKGDVLRVTGARERIARLEERLGHVVQGSLSTDILTLAIGLSLGALLGTVSVSLGNVKLTLGSLALLLVGIALSTLRSRNPALGGPFPESARQLLEDLGLNVFVIILGLGAGSGVARAIEVGALMPLFFGALIVGLVPAFVVWVLGLYVLKMNAAELLGAVAGARCAGSALKSAQEVCQSAVPAVAYPVCFAISSLLFTIVTYLLVLT